MSGIYPCAQLVYVKQTCKPITLCVRVHAQSCLTLCDPTDCSPPGSLSMGFPRQEDWSGLPFPPLGDLPNPGTEPMSLESPPLAGKLFMS